MRFVADNTVGKLRRWMSLLGYDVVYDPRGAREILRERREIAPPTEETAHPAMPRESGQPEGLETRIVLGRCPGLAADPSAAGVFFHVESPRLEEQLAQVAKTFPLPFPETAFTRCIHCNLPLEGPLPLEAVREKVPEKVREWRTEYFRCAGCGRVYWEGTHTDHIRAFLTEKAGIRL